MKPLPIFQVDDRNFVRHFGDMAGQWSWCCAWPELEPHWWLMKVWNK